MANALNIWRFVSRSLTVRLALFLIVLLLLPFFLAGTLRLVDQQRSTILLDATVREGEMLAEALRDDLLAFDSAGTGPLDAQLERMANPSRTVRVFFRPDPVGNGFFSIAAQPRLTESEGAAERERLESVGLFEPLKTSCRGNRPVAERFVNPRGTEELLTFIRPIATPEGCWIVLISHNQPELLQSSIGQSFYSSASFRYALVTYGIIAVVSLWLFVDIFRDMSRIRNAAKAARSGSGRMDFTKMIQVPELRGVTLEIDRLLATVSDGQDLMRRAAEENAHALKTPIAVIQQSLEPLRVHNTSMDENASLSIGVIEKATARLDTLVNAARTLDTVAADSLSATREATDIGAIMTQITESYMPVAATRNVRLDLEASGGLRAVASAEMLETVLENLIENALSFTPPGGVITVQGRKKAGKVQISVLDNGPGVAEDELDKIFSRYYSHRPSKDTGGETLHFGLGLWIVKRNVEAVGGTIVARNRQPNGLDMTVELPGL